MLYGPGGGLMLTLMERLRLRASTPRTTFDRYRRLLLAIAWLLVLAIVGLKGWRLYSYAQALRADVRSLEGFAGARPDAAMLASLELLLARTRGDAAMLRAEAAPLLPIARRLGWVPVYGADLVVAEPLLDLAANLSAAADDVMSAIAPAIGDRGSGQALGVALTARLAAERPRIEAARSSLDRAVDAWQNLPVDRLSAPLPEQLQRVGGLLALAQDGVDLALVAPELFGAYGQRDYLLIAQNPDELRATGGLITGAGTLTVERGRLVAVSIGDSAGVDNLAGAAYPDPPAPLTRYMGIQLWVFRDSNWSPDFPTSAHAAMDLYKLGQRRDVDGVIAFDPATIQLILSAIGPVTIAGIGEPITAQNVVPYMRNSILYAGNESQAAEWWIRRKAFMEPLAKAILARLESDPATLNVPALIQALRRALQERHLLVFATRADVAEVLARRGWDGAVRPGSRDFLMIVDTNMGYNKADPNIRKDATYLVDLSDPAAPTALLTVRHAHRLPAPSQCDQRRGFETIIYVHRYEELMDGCYWDYLRVLVPGGSRLVAATVQPIPAEWLLSGVADDGAAHMSAGEGGASLLSSFFVLPPQSERQTVFRYRLPAGVLSQDAQGWHYHLTLQKQPGTDGLPVGVRVRLPEGAALISASEPAATAIDNTLSFTFVLDRDRQLDLSFRLP